MNLITYTTLPGNQQMVQGIPIGRLNNLDQRITFLEANGIDSGEENNPGFYGIWIPITVTGTDTSFTIAQPIEVEADGLLLFSGYGYTYSAGVITFTNPPQFSAHYTTSGIWIPINPLGSTSVVTGFRPVNIEADGVFLFETGGYTYDSNTSTVTFTNPPQFSAHYSKREAWASTKTWATLTVDGATTTFAVVAQPDFVESDGIILFEGYGYTYSSGAGTISFINPPQFSGHYKY